jgi:hypothetical protein
VAALVVIVLVLASAGLIHWSERKREADERDATNDTND